MILMVIILCLPAYSTRRPVGGRLRLELLQLHAAGRRAGPARHGPRVGAWHEQALHGPDPPDRVRRGHGHRRGEAGRARGPAAGAGELTGAREPRAIRLGESSAAVAATNSRQRSCSSSRQASSRRGSTRRSTGSSSAASASEPITPEPTAARAAAPRTVASAPPPPPGPRSRRPGAGAPAARWSARRRPAGSRPSTVSRIAATTSATRQAIPSSAARATCARVVPPSSPASTARAFGRHHGAPIPASAGSTRALPESSASRASSPSAAGPRPGRAPGRATRASPRRRTRRRRARTPSARRSARRSSAAGRPRARDVVADVGEHEDPGAVGRLDPARDHGPGAGERRLLVDGLPAEAQLGRPARVAAGRRARRRCRGSRGARRSGRRSVSQSAGSQPAASIRCSCVRDAVEGSVAKPAPRRSHRNESTVPMRSVPASRARRRRRRARAARRASRRRSTGRTGSPLAALTSSSRSAEPVEHLLRALVLPDDDRAQRLARSRRPRRAPTRPGGRARRRRPRPGASASTSPIASTTAASTSSPSCSTQPDRGWRLTLSRRASPHRAQLARRRAPP